MFVRVTVKLSVITISAHGYLIKMVDMPTDEHLLVFCSLFLKAYFQAVKQIRLLLGFFFFWTEITHRCNHLCMHSYDLSMYKHFMLFLFTA